MAPRTATLSVTHPTSVERTTQVVAAFVVRVMVIVSVRTVFDTKTDFAHLHLDPAGGCSYYPDALITELEVHVEGVMHWTIYGENSSVYHHVPS